MNSRNLVIGLVVLVVVAALGFYYMNSQKSAVPVPETQTPTEELQTPLATESATTPTEENTVTYQDSGFSPASLTVKVGNSVIFKNESGKSMWVASAPHPTHTAYPEFDAKVGSATGGSYIFTFTKAGTWKYHNHLTPSNTGTIMVE